MTKTPQKRFLRSYFEKKFGGWRAFFKHLKLLGFYYLGHYPTDKNIEWTRFNRTVFICMGNICRSAYAEHKALMEGIPAISAGIDTTSGKPADASAIRVAKLRGIDMRTHKTQTVNELNIGESDLILVMEPHQMNFMIKNCKIRTDQILLLGTLSKPVRPAIQDPFMRSDDYHNQCYKIIDSAVKSLKCRMKKCQFAHSD